MPALGRRGEGWVVLQFVLVAAIVVASAVGPGWPASTATAVSILGAILAVAGAVTAIGAARVLGRSLTPFPSPAAAGRLAVRGPYRVVRHPIYAGGVLFFLGIALVTSPAALAPTGVLAVVWALKLSVEERFLCEAYPEYLEYCSTTRHRLVPFVF